MKGPRLSWDKGALLLLLAVMWPFYFLIVTPRMTSDPVGYVVYAQTLAEGKIFVEQPAADLVFDRGGSFPESVFHGYLFQNGDNDIYPFFGAGFPLFLTGFVAVFGPAYTPLVNLLLLPVFLWLLAVVIRRALGETDSTTARWVPFISVALLFFWFRPHVACWAMTYRELPSLLLGFGGLALVLRPAGASLSVRRLIGAGLLIGLGGWIRETTLALLVPGGLVVLNHFLRGDVAGKMSAKPWLARVVVAGCLMGAGAGIGLAPQLGTNMLYRGSVVGHQVDATTQGVVEEKTHEDGTPSTEGLKLTNLKQMFPRRSLYFSQYLGGWLVALAIGLVVVWRRERLPLALLFVPPAGMYMILYSAFNIPPPVHRYDLMILLFLVPLMALGISWGLQQVVGRLPARVTGRKHASLTAAVAVVAIVAGSQYLTLKQPKTLRSFTYSDLASFRDTMNQHLPDGAIVLSELPARDYVQALTGANAVSLWNLNQMGIDAATLIDDCEKKGIPLFYFETVNRDPGSTPWATVEIRAELERAGHLEPVFAEEVLSPGRAAMMYSKRMALYRVQPAVRETVASPATMTGGAVRVELSGIRPGMTPPAPFAPTPDQGPVWVGSNRVVGVYQNGLPENFSVAPVVEGLPIADGVRVRTEPAQAAHRLRFGRTGEDFAWLTPRWFTWGRSTLSGSGYRLRAEHPLVMAAWEPLFEEDFCLVLEYANPWMSNPTQVVAVEPADEGVQARRAFGCGERPVGMVLTGVRASQTLRVESEQITAGRAVVASMAAGQLRDRVELPYLPALPSPVWAALLVPDAPETACRQVLLTGAPGVDLPENGPEGLTARRSEGRVEVLAPEGHRLMLWRPLVMPYGEGENWVRDVEASHLFHEGFGRLFDKGRWTEARAEILMPQAFQFDGAKIEVVLNGLRPEKVPPPKVRFLLNGNELASVVVADKETVTLTLPRAHSGPWLTPLVIETDTWVPAEWTDSNDKRKLGVVVESLTVKEIAVLPPLRIR